MEANRVVFSHTLTHCETLKLFPLKITSLWQKIKTHQYLSVRSRSWFFKYKNKRCGYLTVKRLFFYMTSDLNPALFQIAFMARIVSNNSKRVPFDFCIISTDFFFYLKQMKRQNLRRAFTAQWSWQESRVDRETVWDNHDKENYLNRDITFQLSWLSC